MLLYIPRFIFELQRPLTMKTLILLNFFGLLMFGTVGCRDNTPAPVVVQPAWKSLSDLSTSRISHVEATTANLIIQNSEGTRRVDPTNAITGRIDLNDTTTIDYPICVNDQYTVVYTYRYRAQLEPILSIYDYSRDQQPLLSVPISQILHPKTNPGHERTCLYYYCEDEIWLNTPYYGSGTLDEAGNLFLALVSQGYTTADYYFHYYKLKLVSDAQNKLTLQPVSDYFRPIYQPNGGGGELAKLYTFTNQSFISYSSSSANQGKLVKINPQGDDQTILNAAYQIDNVFKIANTLYVVGSTSQLWASTDGGSSWQQVKTLTPTEKTFFTNCTTNGDALPLLAVANNTLLRRTDVNAKTDSLIAPASPVYKLTQLNQRYYLWARDSLYYSDNPPALPHH